ncbi:unnamed protein product [Clavelina lepadiformis]|uniref:Uncharacterized protein n=1 Tax=Clavelina lepadiformis TaxID=159417 RepID=A0ABP0GDG0_CLALP
MNFQILIWTALATLVTGSSDWSNWIFESSLTLWRRTKTCTDEAVDCIREETTTDICSSSCSSVGSQTNHFNGFTACNSSLCYKGTHQRELPCPSNNCRLTQVKACLNTESCAGQWGSWSQSDSSSCHIQESGKTRVCNIEESPCSDTVSTGGPPRQFKCILVTTPRPVITRSTLKLCSSTDCFTWTGWSTCQFRTSNELWLRTRACLSWSQQCAPPDSVESLDCDPPTTAASTPTNTQKSQDDAESTLVLGVSVGVSGLVLVFVAIAIGVKCCQTQKQKKTVVRPRVNEIRSSPSIQSAASAHSLRRLPEIPPNEIPRHTPNRDLPSPPYSMPIDAVIPQIRMTNELIFATVTTNT